MSATHRILQVGLGPIGLEMARKALTREGHHIVGAVDIDPKLAGRALKDVIGRGAEGNVLASIEEAIQRFKPDVALVTTVSDLDRVVPSCESILCSGVAVVSTCEEMAYPFKSQPALSARLDAAAKQGGVACLGTGINPGFVLDFLPLALSGPLEAVHRLRAWRVVDASKRRGPLQMKVGAGLSREQFEAKVKAGGFGHRGFPETLHMLCAAFGVSEAGSTTFIEPVISAKEVKTEFAHVMPGQVAGIHQGARDRSGRIELDLKMYVGAENPGDTVHLEGVPSIKVHVDPGYHGDIATCAITLNAIPAVRSARPGFRSMLDVGAITAKIREIV